MGSFKNPRGDEVVESVAYGAEINPILQSIKRGLRRLQSGEKDVNIGHLVDLVEQIESRPTV